MLTNRKFPGEFKTIASAMQYALDRGMDANKLQKIIETGYFLASYRVHLRHDDVLFVGGKQFKPHECEWSGPIQKEIEAQLKYLPTQAKYLAYEDLMVRMIEAGQLWYVAYRHPRDGVCRWDGCYLDSYEAARAVQRRQIMSVVVAANSVNPNNPVIV